MGNLTKFNDILMNANDLCWKEYLFLPKDKNWSLKSICSLIDWDDLDDEDLWEDGETPQFAIDNNLIYALNMATIQDIVNNAKQQRPQCSEADLFEAFMYYYKNDAFITFSE
ncbi:MAG: hypothetical protein Q8936_23970 [Bacillota bacterium]|nr:hypothetical protein [Bacillota bacterium]